MKERAGGKGARMEGRKMLGWHGKREKGDGLREGHVGRGGKGGLGGREMERES